jgi:DNA invertase Pin-like site-specific DNA recombinase
MFGMCSVFAEFERGMIRERVNAGLARAVQKGVKLGRPRIAPELEGRIHGLRKGGMGMIRIKRKLGIGTSTMQRVLAGSANA